MDIEEEGEGQMLEQELRDVDGETVVEEEEEEEEEEEMLEFELSEVDCERIRRERRRPREVVLLSEVDLLRPGTVPRSSGAGAFARRGANDVRVEVCWTLSETDTMASSSWIAINCE